MTYVFPLFNHLVFYMYLTAQDNLHKKTNIASPTHQIFPKISVLSKYSRHFRHMQNFHPNIVITIIAINHQTLDDNHHAVDQ